MTPELHPEAQEEFHAAIDWYDEREFGLGQRFEVSVFDAVDAVVDWPESWPIWPGWTDEPVVRTKDVHDFPYRVVYFALKDTLFIAAVAHDRRRPGYWRDRLSG
ncbi:MAG: type II toxin-antitoxin system RelE/ParE family toxin [Cellulomonas sp.]|nr:type II toxin-antitoxin system RelE/ParE family toxin [Cellulomonas sp.]